MATIPRFNQWSYGHDIVFQLPVPTDLDGETASIVAVKPRSGSRATWTGVVSDGGDTVTYTFQRTGAGTALDPYVYDLDEPGRWICEIVLSDGRTVLEQIDGVTRTMFDVIRAVRSI